MFLSQLVACLTQPAHRKHRSARRRYARRSTLSFEGLERRELLTSFFIDPVHGSDTNSGTAAEFAYRTPRNISFSTAEGNPRYRALEAGDNVYLRDGVHDWSSLLTIPQTYDEHAAFMIRGVHGTAAMPVTIQAFPGEKPIVKARESGVANSAIYILQSEHVKVLGLEVTGTFGPGIRVAEASNVEIANNYVHDVDGVHDNNIAGIYTEDTLGLEIHHNLLHDNYDHARAQQPDPLPDVLQRANSRNIVIFGDGSDRVVVHHNKVFNTPRADGRETGEGIWVKHASQIPGASFEFYDNIVRDVQFSAIGSQSPNTSMHHNLIVNGAPYYIEGGSNVTDLRGHQLEYNTFAGNSAFAIGEVTGLFPAEGFLEFRNNIVVDDEPSYNINNGIIRLETYGPDADYREAVTPQNLQFDRNVYFNPLTSPKWNVFSSTVAFNDDGSQFPAPLGSMMNFAQWRSLGVDANSVVANPQLNASFVPANPAAVNAGWLAGTQPRLTLYVPHDKFSETGGANASSVTIVRSGMSLTLPLTVNLTTSDASEIRLPATATIPAGAAFVSVPIMALDDNRSEPTRAVQIFASATASNQTLRGSEWVRVLQENGNPLPTLSISDVTVTEGSPGKAQAYATFTVTASSTATTFAPVTVRYATADGTARFGEDYTPEGHGLLTLTAARRSVPVTVPITSDTAIEPNETFFLRLSNAVGATISDLEGRGTIVNDDLPQLSISDVTVDEGNSGTRNAVFTVQLSEPIQSSVMVDYVTANGTAVAGQDYTSAAGSLTFAPGTQVLQVSVPITGDLRVERHEKFHVRLRNAKEATITDGEGVGTIRNDDARPLQMNFDADLNADRCVWRPSTGTWHVTNSSNSAVTTRQWGLPDDVPVNGDFDGDGRTDFTVWRPENGTWYVVPSSTSVPWTQQLGLPSDVPAPGDYDGDGRTDLAVWRPSTGTWYVMPSTTRVVRSQQWGLPGDLPVPADYDGDGVTDLAVWRPSNGTWYVIQSTDGSRRSQQWGLTGDIPVPGNYDGDGRMDFAVWRPASGTWYVLQSSTGGPLTRQWGLPGDIPQPADYDGDGRTDFAVWRPELGNWYVIPSSTGSAFTWQWGLPGDRPVANALVASLTKRVTST